MHSFICTCVLCDDLSIYKVVDLWSFVNISKVSLPQFPLYNYYDGYHSNEMFVNRHPLKEVVSPALNCVGNLVNGDDVQTQVNSFIVLYSL